MKTSLEASFGKTTQTFFHEHVPALYMLSLRLPCCQHTVPAGQSVTHKAYQYENLIPFKLCVSIDADLHLQ